jgi:hypothetical protein
MHRFVISPKYMKIHGIFNRQWEETESTVFGARVIYGWDIKDKTH